MTYNLHWTHGSTEKFVYAISASFTAQIESKMEQEDVSRRELASRLNKTSGRISQVLNDPGNLSLRVMVEYAKALGLKVSIVAYDDNDRSNDRGPIRPEVFVKCWEQQNRPAHLFQAQAAYAQHFNVKKSINGLEGFTDIPILPRPQLITQPNPTKPMSIFQTPQLQKESAA